MIEDGPLDIQVAPAVGATAFLAQKDLDLRTARDSEASAAREGFLAAHHQGGLPVRRTIVPRSWKKPTSIGPKWRLWIISEAIQFRT